MDPNDLPQHPKQSAASSKLVEEQVYRGKVYSLQTLPHLRQLLLNPNDSLITVISSVKC